MSKRRTWIRRNRLNLTIGVLVVLLFLLGILWALEKASSPAQRGIPTAGPAEWPLLIKEAFAELKPAVIAFNAPDSLDFDKTVSIELLLSLTASISELQKQLDAIGRREGYEIRASSQMEATLRAARESAFTVVAITPEIQNLGGNEPTRWEWKVTPLKWGKQELDLTISAIYRVDGRDGKGGVRVFHHPIVINVTYWQRAKVFTSNNWQWLWATLVVPIAGWLWARRRRKTAAGFTEDT